MENAINSVEVKTQLRDNSNAAIAAGVFGVPVLHVGDELFWGNDATPMIGGIGLAHPDRFANAEYQRLLELPVGVERRV